MNQEGGSWDIWDQWAKNSQSKQFAALVNSIQNKIIFGGDLNMEHVGIRAKTYKYLVDLCIFDEPIYTCSQATSDTFLVRFLTKYIKPDDTLVRKSPQNWNLSDTEQLSIIIRKTAHVLP
jgi:hypothetical protein